MVDAVEIINGTSTGVEFSKGVKVEARNGVTAELDDGVKVVELDDDGVTADAEPSNCETSESGLTFLLQPRQCRKECFRR